MGVDRGKTLLAVRVRAEVRDNDRHLKFGGEAGGWGKSKEIIM